MKFIKTLLILLCYSTLMAQSDCDCQPPTIVFFENIIKKEPHGAKADYIGEECYTLRSKPTKYGPIYNYSKCLKSVLRSNGTYSKSWLYSISLDKPSPSFTTFDQQLFYKLKKIIVSEGKEYGSFYIYKNVYYIFASEVDNDGRTSFFIAFNTYK